MKDEFLVLILALIGLGALLAAGGSEDDNPVSP